MAATAVVLRSGGSDLATDSAGSLLVHAQPAWWGALGSVLSAVGVFGALPASPVYAGEEFDVALYAHTAGNSLEAYSVEVYYEPALLSYVRHSGSDKLNNLVFEDMGSFMVLNAVGKPASVDDSRVSSGRKTVLLETPNCRVSFSSCRVFMALSHTCSIP